MKAIILIVSVALLVTIAATEPQISLENNVDRPGMNYKSYSLSSADPQVCANDCANDPNCKAFTYVKPGFRGANSQPECWLKNGVPDSVSQEYCVSGVKAPSDSARSAYSGPSTNDTYSSVPGLVLHLWNNMNQLDPKIDSTRQDLLFLDGGDLGAPRDCGYYWWMVPDQYVNPLTWSEQLPPGLVLGLRHSSNQENDGRITVGGQNPVSGPTTYGGLVKQNGGDLGGSEGEGYYWYETYNLNFQNWEDAEKYLPKGTVMGLKHYPNQRDKKVYWRGREYDPVKCFVDPQAFPSPPTFAPKNGGDQGASSGLGYYWFEKITGPDYFQSGLAKVNTICGHVD